MTSPAADLPPIPRPANEAGRLDALYRCRILDTPAEDEFDVLVECVVRVCQASCAKLALVDADRVWVKAAFGMPAAECARDEDCSAWAILEDGLMQIADLASDPRTAGMRPFAGAECLRMFAGANLVGADGHRIGVLCVYDTRSRSLDPDLAGLLARLARQAMALIGQRACQAALKDARADNERLATIDALTGLLNRRVLLERLDVEVERAHRFGSPLSMVMLAVDHFKAINDAGGNASGDAVLRNLGGLVRDELRQVDIAGRYGDGEFCIVLPGTPVSGGMTLADALRREVEQCAHVQGEHRLTATASFGLATLDAEAGEDATTLLKAADDALARAKIEGNRVVCAGADPADS